MTDFVLAGESAAGERKEANAGANVYVGIGSNVGDRLEHLRYGVEGLQRVPGLEVVVASPVYESKAHTMNPSEVQPPYFNAVVCLRSSLDPFSLLDHSRRIERGRGRLPDDKGRWAPRTLDLDLLIFGEEVVRDKGLTIPHPRLGVRRFVLRPLADLAPQLHVPPPYDTTVEKLLEACPDTHHPVRTRHTL